jgi:hypothetical protein
MNWLFKETCVLWGSSPNPICVSNLSQVLGLIAIFGILAILWSFIIFMKQLNTNKEDKNV